MKESIRFVLRCIATPIVIVGFGLFWVGFFLFLGCSFKIFSFLEDEEFSWREHLRDCNEFFFEPLIGMWGKAKNSLDKAGS